ncbi:gag-pol polyprotein [Trifolium medium]|uniref:Gag-pol polyprotein n=1 Tax=Trifolium medium TaxID=97028 RepID=A0A392Q0C2_9FABA|nr:gag-pol polyprotein [Trifolium medium]
MLSTNFENLCMKEEETIHDFHMNVLEFANSFDALGETISDKKLVSKILRSLPKRFDMKVTAIEEAQDLATIQVDELIGSLQTYELGINQRKEKKNKSLAFSSNTGEEEGLGDLESDESLSEAMVLLGRQFNRIMKRMDKRSKSNVPSTKLDISKHINNQRRTRGDEKISQSKELSVMNVRDMDISKLNVLLF